MFAMCLSRVKFQMSYTCPMSYIRNVSFKSKNFIFHINNKSFTSEKFQIPNVSFTHKKFTFIIPWCQTQTCFKNLFLITEIPIYGFALESKKIFMAGLQGEAGGDVRFNSEGDAVSNAHTISKAMPTLSQKQCSYDISNAHYISKATPTFSQKQCSYDVSNAHYISKAMLTLSQSNAHMISAMLIISQKQCSHYLMLILSQKQCLYCTVLSQKEC